jgi:hypothetical protein
MSFASALGANNELGHAGYIATHISSRKTDSGMWDRSGYETLGQRAILGLLDG